MAAPAGARKRKRTADLGSLPQWDLGDLYPARDCAALQRDLGATAAAAKAFRARYEGKLAGLDGAALGAAIAEYERMQETLGRVMSYASLVHAADMSDPEIGRFYQTMHERVNDIGTALLFFTLELNRIDDAALDGQARGAGAGALCAVAARRPRLPSLSTQRRDREAAAREIGRRPRRLDAALRRDRGGAALPRRRQGSHQHRGAASPVRARPGDAQDRGQGVGRRVRQECAALRAHHQHARQGQGDRGPLARLQAADLVPQPRQPHRGRGRRRAHRRRAQRLSQPVAPLLPAEGEMVRRRRACPIGTATRRCPRPRTA